jgi:hypothetical protein
MFTCTKYGDATEPAAKTGVMIAAETLFIMRYILVPSTILTSPSAPMALGSEVSGYKALYIASTLL